MIHISCHFSWPFLRGYGKRLTVTDPASLFTESLSGLHQDMDVLPGIQRFEARSLRLEDTIGEIYDLRLLEIPEGEFLELVMFGVLVDIVIPVLDACKL